MPNIDERPDLTEFEAEWEPLRERRTMPRFLSANLEWVFGVLFRWAVRCVVVVLLFVLALYACGAGARAVQDKLDAVTETSRP